MGKAAYRISTPIADIFARGDTTDLTSRTRESEGRFVVTSVEWAGSITLGRGT